MARATLGLLAVSLSLAVAPTASFARGEQGAAPRLEGAWKVSIVYKVVQGLQDRRVGQRLTETWRFVPRCRRGPCNTELRRGGRSLLLRRTGSTYAGKGTFKGTFFCNGRRYRTGTTYAESWVVRVLRSGRGPRGRRALQISGVGTTVGRSNRNLPCTQVVSLEGVELAGTPVRR